MTDTKHPDHETEAPTTMPAEPTTGPAAPAAHQASHDMDSRMMWVMMIGCCLAIPLALIIGGASLGSLASASPWLIGAGLVLAVALVVARRVSNGPRCDDPPDRHG